MKRQGYPNVWLHVIFVILLQCAASLCSCPPRCFCSFRKASCTSPSFPLVLPSGVKMLTLSGQMGDMTNRSLILPGNEQLKSITLKSAVVGDIQAGALANHRFYKMTFDQVSVGRIWERAFANTTAQTVFIRQSKIKEISTGAFDEMTSENFHFFLTNITTIETRAFTDSKVSEGLTFSLCRLDKVKSGAFNVSFPLIMSMNLFDVFEPDTTSFVIFSYNRLNCNCGSAWLWSPKYDYSDDLSYNKCISPESLKNVYLSKVDPSTLCPKKHT